MLNVKYFYVNRYYLRGSSDLAPIWSRLKKFVPLPTMKYTLPAAAIPGSSARITKRQLEPVTSTQSSIGIIFIMAKARFSKGLRRGSTKTETYSTLATRKDGRIQIIKDRVYDIANPQTVSQMQQRVIFATVASAAKHMYPLISISQEGETKPEYARQLFISQNIELLKRTVGKRVGLQNHYLSAFAPKSNDQLIPNSYQVSKGSLTVPAYLVPKTTNGGSSFQYSSYDGFGVITQDSEHPVNHQMGALVMGQTYNAADIWRILFGLLPGDQITVPQIAGDETAQSMIQGSTVVDKTLVTTFAAPRLVLLSEMPATTITFTENTIAEDVVAVLRTGIDEDSSFAALVDQIFESFIIDETVENDVFFRIDDSYDDVYGVLNGTIRALGVILSRKDSNGKWQYSTSNLCCAWDFISQNSGADYFGFTLDNAISTYLPTAQTDANGNFLQRGGDADIVPESFS